MHNKHKNNRKSSQISIGLHQIAATRVRWRRENNSINKKYHNQSINRSLKKDCNENVYRLPHTWRKKFHFLTMFVFLCFFTRWNSVGVCCFVLWVNQSVIADCCGKLCVVPWGGFSSVWRRAGLSWWIFFHAWRTAENETLLVKCWSNKT